MRMQDAKKLNEVRPPAGTTSWLSAAAPIQPIR
jgi:hypothetical protein